MGEEGGGGFKKPLPLYWKMMCMCACSSYVLSSVFLFGENSFDQNLIRFFFRPGLVARGPRPVQLCTTTTTTS